MKTPIVPVSYGPLGTGNLLTIRGIGPINDSGQPNYSYAILAVTTDDPPVSTQITIGNIAMTSDQWNNWGDLVPDEDYQLDCLATNLGLTIL